MKIVWLIFILSFLFIGCETELIVNNGTGSGMYKSSTTVPINGNGIPEGMKFYRWRGDIIGINDLYQLKSSITIPLIPKKVTEIEPVYIPDNEMSAVIVTDGTGGGVYSPGTVITIEADSPPSADLRFSGWDGTVNILPNKKLSRQTFRVQRDPLNFIAMYDSSYNVVVKKGSGSGSYFPGERVSIVAEKPAAGSYLTFKEWTGDIQLLSNTSLSSVTFNMPKQDVNLSAMYLYNEPTPHPTATPNIGNSKTYSMDWRQQHNRSFTWLDRTGGAFGGPIRIVFSDGCGELYVPDAIKDHNMNNSDARFFCGTNNKPGESNGTKSSVFAKVGCRASSVTIYYSN